MNIKEVAVILAVSVSIVIISLSVVSCDSENIDQYELDENGMIMLYKCYSCKRTMLSRRKENDLYDQFRILREEYGTPSPNRP